MCTYSLVVDDWMNPRSPNNIPDFSPFKQLPALITPDIAKQMLEVLRRLDALDKRLGLHECKLNELEKSKIVKKLKRRATRKRK